MHYMFLNTESQALTLISAKNEHFTFFEDTQTEIFKGTRKDCLGFIEGYFEENYIPDEFRIFQELKTKTT